MKRYTCFLSFMILAACIFFLACKKKNKEEVKPALCETVKPSVPNIILKTTDSTNPVGKINNGSKWMYTLGWQDRELTDDTIISEQVYFSTTSRDGAMKCMTYRYDKNNDTYRPTINQYISGNGYGATVSEGANQMIEIVNTMKDNCSDALFESKAQRKIVFYPRNKTVDRCMIGGRYKGNVFYESTSDTTTLEFSKIPKDNKTYLSVNGLRDTTTLENDFESDSFSRLEKDRIYFDYGSIAFHAYVPETDKDSLIVKYLVAPNSTRPEDLFKVGVMKTFKGKRD